MFAFESRTCVADGCVCLEVAEGELETISRNAPAGLQVVMCLDKYCLLLPQESSGHRVSVVAAFFDFIGDEYENISNVQHNIQNISHMLKLSENYCSLVAGDTIVDFGCGTGIAASVIDGRTYHLIGIERCAKMRELAHQRGVVTVAPEEVTQLPAAFSQIAIASYVMHFLPPEEDISAVWRLLQVGGVFVANFHKNLGVSYADTFLGSLGAEVAVPSLDSNVTTHGTYRVYRKLQSID